jgi:hypothetical protein
MPTPEPPEKGDYVPVKIRRGTYKTLKIVAAWRDMSILDYLDELVQRKGTPDLRHVTEEIKQVLAQAATGQTGRE